MSRMMKDSGVEWIGKIPEDWTYARMKNLQDNNHPYPIGDGDHGQIKPEHYQNEGIPYIRVQNLGRGTDLLLDDVVYISEEVNNNNKKSILHPGDILVAKTGATFGKTGIIPDDMEQANTTSSVGKITVSKDFSNKYVFYCLGSDVCYKQMGLIASQKSAQPGFNIEDLVDFYIPFPSSEEQQKIADYLDKKCSKIDEQKANYEKSIELLKEYKQSLITEAVTKGLNKNVEMKDSGIAWIGKTPNNRKVIHFKYTHNGANVGEGLSREYWSNNPEDIVYYTAGLEPIFTTFTDFPEGKSVKENDLLLARNGTPYIYLPEVGAAYSDHIIRVSINTGYDKRYLRYSLQQSIYSEVVDAVSLATRSISLWDEQYISCPGIEEQKQIADYLDKECGKIDKVINYREQMIEKLDEYKKSLIYECVTGKKEIK